MLVLVKSKKILIGKYISSLFLLLEPAFVDVNWIEMLGLGYGILTADLYCVLDVLGYKI